MDEKRKARLEAAGIDMAELSERFMNNDALMTRFLSRFPQDKNHDMLKRALADGDVQAAYNAAHTLKGVTGNLSMHTLFTAVCNVVEPLRSGNLAEAENNVAALDAAYEAVINALTQQ